MLAWVAVALALEHAATADAERRLLEQTQELLAIGAKLKQHRGQLFSPDEVEDLTERYHIVVENTKDAYSALASRQEVSMEKIEMLLKKILQVKDSIAEVEEAAAENAEGFNDRVEATDELILELQKTVNATADEKDNFIKEAQHNKEEADTELDQVQLDFDDQLNKEKNHMFDADRESKAYLKSALNEAENDVKTANREAFGYLDDRKRELDQSNEELPESTEESKRERDGLVDRQRDTFKHLADNVKGFEKGFQRFEKTYDKNLGKYSKGSEKTDAKMYKNLDKQMAVTSKEILKNQNKEIKFEDKKVAKEERKEVRNWAADKKVYGKESVFFEKDAAKARKEMARAAVRLAKDFLRAGDDAAQLHDEVKGGEADIARLGDQLESKVQDSRASLQADLLVERKAKSDEAVAAGEQLAEQVSSKYASLEATNKEQLDRLRKEVVDISGEKLSEAAKRAATVILAQIEDSTNEQLRAHTLGKEFHSEAAHVDKVTGGVEQRFDRAKNVVETALKSMTDESKREMGMNKVTMMGLGKQFVGQTTKNLDIIDSKAVTSLKDKALQDSREVGRAFMEQLRNDAETKKQVAQLMLKQAQDMRNHATTQDSAIDALQGQDVGKILRSLQTQEKIEAAKVSSVNNTLRVDLLDALPDRLKKAHNALRSHIEEKGQQVLTAEKLFLEKIGLTNQGDLQRLFELVKEADSADKDNSEHVLEGQSILAEKLRGMAEQLVTNKETYDQVVHSAESAQAEIGPQGLANLESAIKARGAHQMGDFESTANKVYHDAKQTGRKYMDSEVDKFSGKTHEYLDDAGKKIRHALAMVTALETRTEHESRELSNKAEEGGSEAEQIILMLTALQEGLQSESVSIEAGADSNAKELSRAIQAILDEGKAGVERQQSRARALLHSAKMELGQQLADLEHGLVVKNNEMKGASMEALAPFERAVENEKDTLKQTVSQADAVDGAMQTGLSDGLRRWEDREADVGTKTAVMERGMIAAKAKPPKAEQVEDKGRLSEERAEAGIQVLGEETESLSQSAGDGVALAGGQVASQAKAAGMGIQLQLNGIEAQEKRAFQEQSARDEALSTGVGSFLSSISDVQQAGMRRQADLAAGGQGIEQLLKNEHESLTQNIKFLKNFQQQEGEHVAEMLGHVTKAMEIRLHKSTQGLADIAAQQHMVEGQLDEILGSAAYKQLAKLRRADDFSTEVLMDDEFLRDWIGEYNASAADWREGIEKAFASHEEAAALHAAEVQAGDAENKERLAEYDEIAKQNLEKMAGSIESAASTDEIEQGVEKSMAMFGERQKAGEALDEARIKSLLTTQERLGTKMQGALDAGRRELERTQKAGGKSNAEFFAIQKLLGNLAAQHDEEVAAKMKALAERQRAFDRALLTATVGGGGQPAAPTEKDVQDLVKEAESLSQEHEELGQKRQAVGQKISGLFAKLSSALEQAHAEAKAKEDAAEAEAPAPEAAPEAALVQAAGKEKQLRMH